MGIHVLPLMSHEVVLDEKSDQNLVVLSVSTLKVFVSVMQHEHEHTGLL